MAKKKTCANKPDAIAALQTLASLLGVDLTDDSVAVTTEERTAKVRMYDGSLEAELRPTNRRELIVTAPLAPAILIELVDQSKGLAPVGAIFEITAYRPSDNAGLNGDVYCVYVGRDGLLLNRSALERASKLYAELFR